MNQHRRHGAAALPFAILAVLAMSWSLLLCSGGIASANCQTVGRRESIRDTYNMPSPNGLRRPVVSAYFSTSTCGYHTSGSLSLGAGRSLGGDDAMYGTVRFKTNTGRVVNNPGASQAGPSDYLAVSNGAPFDLRAGERITQSNVQLAFFQKQGGSAILMGRRFMACTFGPEAGDTSGGCTSGSGSGPF